MIHCKDCPKSAILNKSRLFLLNSFLLCTECYDTLQRLSKVNNFICIKIVTSEQLCVMYWMLWYTVKPFQSQQFLKNRDCCFSRYVLNIVSFSCANFYILCSFTFLSTLNISFNRFRIVVIVNFVSLITILCKISSRRKTAGKCHRCLLQYFAAERL